MTDYKLMPEEATPEMEQAAEKYWNDRKFKALSDDPRTWKGLYAAMRAAAPAVQGEPVAGLLGEVCGGDASHNTVNVVLDNPAPWSQLPIGSKVSVQPQPAQQWSVPEETIQYLAGHLNEINKAEDGDRDHDLERHLDCVLQALSKAPQPAEQQPAPDVAWLVARAALAAHRKQGGEA